MKQKTKECASTLDPNLSSDKERLASGKEPGFFASLKNDTKKVLTGTKSRIFS
jgi:hypothetical protein